MGGGRWVVRDWDWDWDWGIGIGRVGERDRRGG